ncbi:MAG: glycosyltransferase family 2 protein [Pseudomonadota bacterium]
MKKILSVLCPIHNEETVIPLFMERAKASFEVLSERYDLRIVFLDNGSSDDSHGVVSALADSQPNVYLLRMSRNVGYQNSINTGLRTVESDVYAIIDVDCEDPPEMLVRFSDQLEKGHDIAYGVRADRPEPRWIKRLRNLFYRILREVSDDDSILYMAEFSMFTREVRDAIIDERNSFPFIRSGIARVGFRRIGLPYTRHARIAGETHYNLVGMTLFAIGGVLASTTLPLRLPIYALPIWLTLVAGLGSMAITSGNNWYIFWAVMLSAFYFGWGIAFIALYTARTYKNSLQRPSGHVQPSLSRLPPTSGARTGSGG